MSSITYDISNQTFGEWKVIEYIKNSKWLCECSCGVQKEVGSTDLRQGKTKSCGHKQSLIGKKFGKWTVIDHAEDRKDKHTMWLCQCSCENKTTRSVGEYQLVNGKSCSCGCEKGRLISTKRTKNISNQRFGKLFVIELLGNKKKLGHVYLCKCDCGNEKEISRTAIVQHGQQNCGECEISGGFIDITGKKFNRWTVIKYIGDSLWLCECECGIKRNVHGTTLRSAHSKSCGCYKYEVQLEFKCLEGEVFNRWVVIKDYRDNDNIRHTICECDCGTIRKVDIGNLASGISKSCGCLKSELSRERRGENHPNWDGGGTNLKIYLRKNLTEWKMLSLELFNYECVISKLNESNLHIHHLYPFSKIFKETMRSINLPIYQNIGKYTNKQLDIITNKCRELHIKYGLGVPMTQELHYEFHKEYGQRNFTPEDFYQFYKDKTGREFNPSFLFSNEYEREVI